MSSLKLLLTILGGLLGFIAGLVAVNGFEMGKTYVSFFIVIGLSIGSLIGQQIDASKMK